MFGWRKKKTDDFEWHQYVRTTILLRREQRREKVAQAKSSAARGAKSAIGGAWQLAKGTAQKFIAACANLARKTPAALVQTSRSMGRAVARLLSRISSGAIWIGASIASGLAAAWALAMPALAAVSAPIAAFLSRPSIRAPLGWTGWLAAVAGLWQWGANGWEMQTKIALAISATALLLAYGSGLFGALSRLMPTRNWRLPAWALAAGKARRAPRNADIASPCEDRPPRRAIFSKGAAFPKGALLPKGAARVVGPAVAALGILALLWFGLRAMPPLPQSFSQLASKLPLVSAPPPILGRARALTGNLLQIAGTTIRLAGIDAPLELQRCKKGRRSWRCGRAARRALARLVRRKQLHCRPEGKNAQDHVIATCFISSRKTQTAKARSQRQEPGERQKTGGPKDVGALLVRKGHVFAQQNFLAAYSGLETLAQQDKLGLWRGEALRPADYRARKWEEAKRRSPDGCPIKGDVTRAGKIYVLPWAKNYKRTRIRSARGERWFCSENAARAAGWRRRDRS